ncbi:MAG: aminoacyl-tRNA hydrolase [Dehalococcoidales bacterium]|nr:aminoacyl-tRNA hydrolase [Dehalococcoidales bacterium]
MKLIAGLGNPGRKYERTRHNLGFLSVNHLANRYKIKLNKSQGKARTGTGVIEGEQVMLARPQTFMNLSGQSVSLLLNKLHITPEDLIVIHDDLDLPVGRIRVKFGGGSGGHKGIESIFSEIHNRNFYRIRIGIGSAPYSRTEPGVYEKDVIDYVLSTISSEEKEIIEEAIPLAAEATVSLITDGLTATMNRYNSGNRNIQSVKDSADSVE